MSKPEVDSTPESGHAIPQWLRDQFDVIELQVRQMGAEAVFTQMCTKVQAYFEMLRAVERGNAGRELFLTGRAAESVICPTCGIADCHKDALNGCIPF